MKGKSWIKATEFSGQLTRADFKLVEEDLPELKDGDVLFEATFLTVDPYMRTTQTKAGGVMPGQQVARVIQSKHPQFPVGSEWVCQFGWRSQFIFNPIEEPLPGKSLFKEKVIPLPDLGDLPRSLALGVIGMPGATAHIGLLEYGELKSGETVLVNGAAGAVGSLVGQIAKIKGCKVIGYVGTDDKVRWLKEELGFDFAFNYKKVDLSESLTEAAPDGIDVYFDNIGGDFSDTVITNHMRMFGRIPLIGNMSGYNATEPLTGPQLYKSILTKRLSIRGFMAPDSSKEKWTQAYKDLTKWIKEGKLKYREHVTEGFDKMPEALMELFTSSSIGKAIIKV